MRSAQGGAARKRNSAANVRGRISIVVPHAEAVFHDALRGQLSTRVTPSEHSFKSVDLSDQENKVYWLRLWNVTDIQLKIAVSRVGTAPLSVKQEIFGGRTSASDLT